MALLDRNWRADESLLTIRPERWTRYGGRQRGNSEARTGKATKVCTMYAVSFVVGMGDLQSRRRV